MQAQKTKKVYLSGKMSGLPDHGFPAFNEATKTLRDMGYDVFNPAETDDGDISQNWEYYMKIDIREVTEADLIVVLPGWESSKGANTEILVANLLGIPIYNYPDFDKITNLPKLKMVDIEIGNADLSKCNKTVEPIVDEAKRLVGGDRQDAYGHPYWDFLRTSTMWTGLLVEKLKPGIKLEPEEVGMMMNLLKMSRHMNKKKRDNLVDAHGYLITVDMVETYRKENNV